jgi:hypothetical protein
VDTFESNVLLNLDDVFCFLEMKIRKRIAHFWEFLVFFVYDTQRRRFSFWSESERLSERVSMRWLYFYLR